MRQSVTEIGRSRRNRLAWLLGSLLVVLAAGLAWRGYEYYRLPLETRVEHEDYRVLGPSGLVGHGYGIVGTGLILLNLAYLVRRRLAHLPLGSMRAWLDLHVFTGLSGSMLILFHSAFQLRTPIAITSSVSLAFVVLTGIIGRWLHALVPEEDSDELEEQLHGLEAFLPGAATEVRRALAGAPATRLDAHARIGTVIGTLPEWLDQTRERRRRAREAMEEATELHQLDAAERKLLRRVRSRVIQLAGRGAVSSGAASFLRTWRGLHRVLAILMLLTVPIHIGVAWLYGYRWIWSE
jgi:hypothetical protein